MLLLASCSKESNVPEQDPVPTKIYFPPITGNDWESLDPASLNWDVNKLADLYGFLEDNNTRAFIILKDGKIVVEQYWGKNILNTADFDKNSQWYWASAGKSLTAVLVGIAQQEGDLDIEQSTSKYLENGWTSMDPEKEQLIKVKHQLSMTTGLDYEVPDLDCTQASCLKYKADAGKQWFYHNAPYTLLEQVVSNATGIDYNLYTDQKIENVTGMEGQWIPLGSNNVYWSSARSMARFGLLILGNGKWNESTVIQNDAYFHKMLSSSQELNPSYGYLWWLNGKGSIILPGLPNSFNMDLSENAPDDLLAAMGKNGQFVEIVPCKGLVVVRMGEAPDNSLVPIEFHDEMWAMINQVVFE